MFIKSIGFLAALSASVASAQDLNWQTVRIKSEGRAALCNENTVFTSYFDSFASFIFTSLGVNMPAGDLSRLTELGACNIRSRITIPQGLYLTGLQQTITGGTIKSQGARGFIRSRIFLRTLPDASGRDRPALPIDTRIDPEGTGLVAAADLAFRPMEEGHGDILNLYNDANFGPGQRQVMCQWTRQRAVNVDVVWRVAVAGQRASVNKSIILQVDGSDNQFKLNMAVGACR
jgi:hypothetical protein